MQAYFRDLYGNLRVGPPLYLVVRGLNVSGASGDADKVCSVAGCRRDSLGTRVRGAPGMGSLGEGARILGGLLSAGAPAPLLGMAA